MNCSCNKFPYRSKAEAKRAIKVKFPSERMQAYHCQDWPHLWHIGHVYGLTRDQHREKRVS